MYISRIPYALTALLLLASTIASPLPKPHDGHNESPNPTSASVGPASTPCAGSNTVASASPSSAPIAESENPNHHGDGANGGHEDEDDDNLPSYTFAFKDPSVVTKDIIKKLEPYGFKPSHLGATYSYVFNGFEAKMSDHCVGVLKSWLPDGVDIEPTVTYKPYGTIRRMESAELAKRQSEEVFGTWALQRMSQSKALPGDVKNRLGSKDFTFTFPDGGLGEGVDIYVLDTGVRATHDEFDGARATIFDRTSDKLERDNDDLDGHGYVPTLPCFCRYFFIYFQYM